LRTAPFDDVDEEKVAAEEIQSEKTRRIEDKGATLTFSVSYESLHTSQNAFPSHGDRTRVCFGTS